MAPDSSTAWPDIRFTVGAVGDLGDLEKKWRRLEERAAPSLFQSWGWIGTWLATLPTDRHPHLLIGESDGRLVALALLARSNSRRHGVLLSRGLYLNETGDPRFDVLTVEYNGVLTDRSAGPDIAGRALRYLVENLPDWDELWLRGVPETYVDTAAGAGLWPRVIARRPCSFVDLAGLRQGKGDYLSRLSRNTRYQLRRSLRVYGGRGELGITAAASAGEALEFFAEMKTLHQAYWVGRGKPGSFANPYFEQFHTAFLRDRFAHGEADMLLVAVGGRPIGYLYNFVHAGRVYNYQSGFAYEDDPAVKPGFVSHYLAIEHYLAGTAAIYDFMAGAGQHKQSLETDRTVLLDIMAQRPCMKYRVEEALRNVKQLVLRNVRSTGGEKAAPRSGAPAG